MVAQLRHDTPVLGAGAEAVVLRHSVFGVEFADFVLPPEGHQICQTISALLIKGTPVPGSSQDFGCGDAGEPLASAIPDLSLIHISEPTRRTPISYAVFCLKKKKKKKSK